MIINGNKRLWLIAVFLRPAHGKPNQERACRAIRLRRPRLMMLTVQLRNYFTYVPPGVAAHPSSNVDSSPASWTMRAGSVIFNLRKFFFWACWRQRWACRFLIR